MPVGLNLVWVAAAFLASVAIIVGTGLFALSLVLRAQARHRRRIARFARKRMAGRLDFDETRISLLKQRQESNTLVGLTDALAPYVPLLDTARLRARMVRAGLTLSVGSFVLLSLIAALVVALVLRFAAGLSFLLLLPPSLYLGMLIVDGYVGLRGDRLANRFMRQLPDALDTIIRGIRSGLPVIECIGTVGKEYGEPIGGHFQAVSERVSLGEPLEAALWRVVRVVNKPEMDFLAIAISIQIETGGSLAEAPGNLSELLRKRQQMKLKIRAISSEARASAMIIGALPFVMLAVLSFMNPAYVAPLFTDPRGQMMLMAGLASITVGAFIMWRMTQFEI
ncbi:hypothetical protein BH23PSE1_BH23PSE1_18630 [soil metagenome]